jgi:hypothetical protein
LLLADVQGRPRALLAHALYGSNSTLLLVRDHISRHAATFALNASSG